jgi:hypothetical protein
MSCHCQCRISLHDQTIIFVVIHVVALWRFAMLFSELTQGLNAVQLETAGSLRCHFSNPFIS